MPGTRTEAAQYVGIGITLLSELDVPFLRLGRRSLYDRIDLDRWLDEYKQRGRPGKEHQWPEHPESTGANDRAFGGLQQPFRTANAYAKALD